MNGRKSYNAFAMLIGVFLIVEGVWGLFSETVFGILTTNTLHAIIHIVLGIVGLYLSNKGRARGYCIFLGILLLAVGILRFVPGPDEIVIDLLNVNEAVAYLNIAAGVISLLLALSAKRNASKPVSSSL
jgi:uncharacterized membrane protein